jgi:hypothetical protein
MLSSVYSFAQESVLYEGNWFLVSLVIEGQEFNPPSNEEVPTVYLTFEDLDAGKQFSTGGCNGLFGFNLTFNTNPESFNIGELNQTLISCEGPDASENENFEFLYFNFFGSDSTEPFEYLFTIIDFDDGTSAVDLMITSDSGNTAYYIFSKILSTQDFTKANFSIYPNPVEEKLFITTLNEIAELSVDVFDIYGKLILTKKLNNPNENSIEVSQLISGIYFAVFKNKQGKTQIKKFIKI